MNPHTVHWLIDKHYDINVPRGTIQPKNTSWITKVRASSWRTWENQKMSHHHRGDHEFFNFTMHPNTLHGCFALNCYF